MIARRVVYTRRAERDLMGLPLRVRTTVFRAIDAWAHQKPYVDVEKLTDSKPPQWRIRVGRIRALLDLPNPDTIRVLRVLDRKDAYR